MPILLAIETSTSACSVALRYSDGSGHRDLWLHSEQPRTHSTALLAMIEQLLAEAALSPTQLSAVAISNGPGSFTGLRIGLAVAQGIAVGLELPLLPVNSLEVLALTAQQQLSLPPGQPLLAVTDARMGQYNTACFALPGSGQRAQWLAPAALVDEVELLAQCAQHEVLTVVGELDGITALHGSAQRCQPLQPRADAMLNVAAHGYQAGDWPRREQVELLYLRGTEAWQQHQPIVAPSPR